MKAIVNQSDATASDALQFLSAALDTEGWICILALDAKTKAVPPIQKFFASGQYTEAVNEALRLDAKGLDTYWCTCTLKGGGNRLKTNAQRCRVFKLDLDIGKEEKKYENKEAAVKALKKFIKATGMPMPTVVDSGGGVHCYWILTVAMDFLEWDRYAKMFAVMVAYHGFKVDTAVTTNPVGILRVPGTRNYKYDEPLPVTVANPIVHFETEAICDIIKREYNKHPAPVVVDTPAKDPLGHIPKHVRVEGVDDFTKNLLGGKPKKFEVILKKSVAGIGCPQLHEIATNQAETIEPRWRAALSIAYNCVDGLSMIHKISSAHPKYTHAETQREAKRLSDMPFQCRTIYGLKPEGCKGCTHFIESEMKKADGKPFKLTSPIQLGEFIEEVSASAASATSDEDAALIARLAALPKLQYDRVRVKEAKAINVRVDTLDKLVEQARGEKAEEDDAPFMEVERWPDPVVPADLLQQITALVQRFVVCEQQTAIAAALWIALS